MACSHTRQQEILFLMGNNAQTKWDRILLINTDSIGTTMYRSLNNVQVQNLHPRLVKGFKVQRWKPFASVAKVFRVMVCGVGVGGQFGVVGRQKAVIVLQMAMTRLDRLYDY
jgi:hypothetical protein